MMRTRWLVAAAAVLLVGLVAGLAIAQDGGRPYLGIQFEQREDGALIVAVMPDSPAHAAGLRVNDLITAVNGEPIGAQKSLLDAVRAYAPGDTITLSVERRGKTLEIAVTLGTWPEETPVAPPESGAVPGEEAILARHIRVAGVTFADLDERWLVTAVTPDSPAEEAGLQVGDQVTAIDGHAPETYDSGVLATRAAQGAELPLTVERNGETLELTLALAPGTPVETFIARVTRPVRPAVVWPVVPFAVPVGEPRGYLGVVYVTLTPELLDELAGEEELPFALPTASEGALIVEVMAETPAAQAGLQPGDVVTTVDGDVVDAERTLADRIYAYEAGDTITLGVLRGDEALQVEVTLAARPPQAGIMIMPGGQGMQPFGLFLDPNFDLDRFLEENPDFFEQLRQGGFERFFPGAGQLFNNPDFDWKSFLAEHPAFAALLGRLAERFNPEELQELLPNFPWFSEDDPFHGEMNPAFPGDAANAPA